MVEASPELHSPDGNVLPIHTFNLTEGERVNVHHIPAGRIFTGIVHFAEVEGETDDTAQATAFEVRPLEDMYGKPMGKTHTINFDDLTGDNPPVVIF
jgi:hypothetical protein